MCRKLAHIQPSPDSAQVRAAICKGKLYFPKISINMHIKKLKRVPFERSRHGESINTINNTIALNWSVSELPIGAAIWACACPHSEPLHRKTNACIDLKMRNYVYNDLPYHPAKPVNVTFPQYLHRSIRTWQKVWISILTRHPSRSQENASMITKHWDYMKHCMYNTYPISIMYDTGSTSVSTSKWSYSGQVYMLAKNGPIQHE